MCYNSDLSRLDKGNYHIYMSALSTGQDYFLVSPEVQKYISLLEKSSLITFSYHFMHGFIY